MLYTTTDSVDQEISQLTLWNSQQICIYTRPITNQQCVCAVLPIESIKTWHLTAVKMSSWVTYYVNKESVIQALESIDPFSKNFVNLRYPVDVWNYIIFCIPPVTFVMICTFIWAPIVAHFLHWAPKLLWPKLLGFPLLHEILRRFTQITNPQPPSIADVVRFFENIAAANTTGEVTGAVFNILG